MVLSEPTGSQELTTNVLNLLSIEKSKYPPKQIMDDSLYQDTSTNMHAANEDVAKFMGTFGNMNYNNEDQSCTQDLTSMNLTPSHMNF